MSVLINEFEIVPASEEEAEQRSDSASPPLTTKVSEQLEAAEVHRLIQRREERMIRVWAH
jgi:hypothetical protein